MTTRTRKWLLGSLGILCVLGAFLGGGVLLTSRSLTEHERELIGDWSFLEPDDPDTRIVYRLRGNSRVSVEQYSLTSATPLEPLIRTEGVWRREPDGTFVVEAAEGPLGWWIEASRWSRELAGQPGNSHPMLRRIYPDTRCDAQGLHSRPSRPGPSGKSERVDLVMERLNPVVR